MTDNSKDVRDDINEINIFMHEGISSVVTVSNELLSLNKESTLDDVLDLLTERLKKFKLF